MDCQSFEWQAQLLLDGKLSVPEQQALYRHAEDCPSCAALLHDMEALEALLRTELRQVEPPAGFADAVMAALPETAPVIPFERQRKWTAWVRYGGLTAAAALLLAVGARIAPTLMLVVAEDPPLDPAHTAQGINEPVRPETQDERSLVASNLGDPEADIQDHNQGTQTADPLDATEANGGALAQPGALAEPDAAILAEQEPLVQFGSVDLPAPAYRPAAQEGSFPVVALAGHENCNAILPSLNEDGKVVYYTYYRSGYYQWTVSLEDDETAELVGRVDNVPPVTAITGSMDNGAVLGHSAYSAFSPDGSRWAINQDGEDPSVEIYSTAGESVKSLLQLFVSTSEEREAEALAGQQIGRVGSGGGTVLSWSPGSNNLLYTDAAGMLYVYMLYQGDLPAFSVFEGTVSSACWLDDSTILLSGTPSGESYSNIYLISIR